MKHQSIPLDIEARNDLFEEGTANLVAECRGIIKDRLKNLFAAVSSEMLAKQLWQGSIEPSSIQQALLSLDKLQAFLADLSLELSSLTAGVLERPVLLRLVEERLGITPEVQARLLGEQLAWSRKTVILNKTLMETCHLVWNRAVSDCAWPVRKLKPGKLLWRMLGTTPQEEEKRCLQELTWAVEGVRVNMQKRLFKAISIQVAVQLWALYDDLSQDQTTDVLMNLETDYCA
ncbi:MAG: hypothetical protein ABSC17_00705 [Thermacetogeniaceae bacterium]